MTQAKIRGRERKGRNENKREFLRFLRKFLTGYN